MADQTPRERLEDEITRKVKGIFREFEDYLRQTYGLTRVDQARLQKAQRLTQEFAQRASQDTPSAPVAVSGRS